MPGSSISAAPTRENTIMKAKMPPGRRVDSSAT
jgi:hypothetical protein